MWWSLCKVLSPTHLVYTPALNIFLLFLGVELLVFHVAGSLAADHQLTVRMYTINMIMSITYVSLRLDTPLP